MSIRGFIAGLFRGMKPSDALLRYVEGTGGGYELDDLVHASNSEETEREAIEPLLEISRRYSTREYLIGISNPASFPEIRALAECLQSKGL